MASQQSPVTISEDNTEINVESKRKNTHFQITKVLESRPPSHDPEESGDDDPDDSHTEDISDLDNVLTVATAVLNAAPVARGRFNILPCVNSGTSNSRPSTNSNALLTSTMTSTSVTTGTSGSSSSGGAAPATSTSSSSQSSLANTIITATAGVLAHLPNPNRAKSTVAYPPHGPKDRFKVVKIVTSMPLRRGRWSIVDYPDKDKDKSTSKDLGTQPPQQQQQQQLSSASVPASIVSQQPPPGATTAEVAKHHEQSEATPGGGQAQVRPSTGTVPPSGAQPTTLNTAPRTVTNNLHNLGAMQPQQPPTSGAVAATVATQDPTLTNVATTHHSYLGPQAPHATVQHPHMQTSSQPPPQVSPQTQTLPQPQQPSQQQQQQPQQAPPPQQQQQQQPTTSNHHPQLIAVPSQSQTTSASVASAPTGMQQPQAAHPMQQQTPMTSPPVTQPQQPQYVRPVELPHQPASGAQHPVQQQQQQPPRSQQFQFISSGQTSVVNSVPPSRDPKQGIAAGAPSGVTSAAGPSQVGTPTMNIQPPPSHSSPQVQSGTPVPPAVVSAASVTGGGGGASATGSALAQVPQAPQTYVDTAVRDSHPIASEELVERLEEISTQQGSPDATGDDPESASGSNQGAIDNRIEQAMDLVKSHLMNAVRSEVEELKEKIVKLEETISNQAQELSRQQNDFNREVGRLQAENEFLRRNVDPDVLVQWNNNVQQQQQPPQQQPQQPQQQPQQQQNQEQQRQQQQQNTQQPPQPPPQH